MSSGIKQGCPSSGTLFALALDLFIRMVLMKTPRSDVLLRAFADDLACVLKDLFSTLPGLLNRLRLLELAAHLKANAKRRSLSHFFGMIVPTYVIGYALYLVIGGRCTSMTRCCTWLCS